MERGKRKRPDSLFSFLSISERRLYTITYINFLEKTPGGGPGGGGGGGEGGKKGDGLKASFLGPNEKSSWPALFFSSFFFLGCRLSGRGKVWLGERGGERESLTL